MPSPFSSFESVEDAKELARNLGIEYNVIPISEIYTSVVNTLKPVIGGTEFDATEENIQTRIRTVLRERGYTLTMETPTNQIFITMDNETIARLQEHVRLGFMEKADDTHTVMRICTAWSTTDEQVDELIALL